MAAPRARSPARARPAARRGALTSAGAGDRDPQAGTMVAGDRVMVIATEDELARFQARGRSGTESTGQTA